MASRLVPLLACLLALLAASCSAAPTPTPWAPPPSEGVTAAPPGLEIPWPAAPPALKAQHFEAGRSVEGRPIRVHVLGRGADVTLILAAIHGNEGAGMPLALRLVEHLAAIPEAMEGRRAVIVPVANPDGHAAKTRANARGVDVNRNFPAANHRGGDRGGVRALSEPESRAIDALIHTYHPTRIVSIHQPLRCVDHDGPAGALADRMAGLCDLPLRKLGTRPGSLGAYAGEDLGIPIITLELPLGVEQLDAAELWPRYGPALVEAVMFGRETGR